MKLLPDPLKALVRAVFTGAGCGEDEADCIAEHLVASNLAGHDSHGVVRVPIYVKFLREGKVFANRTLRIVVDEGALAVADGQLGFGQWIGKQAVELGIEKCRRHGVSVVALRNSGHLGRIGHWAEMAAAAGLVSLLFVNSSGLGMHVVPFGGIDQRLSVNPVSIGVPGGDGAPVILDIAAAATAEGKLRVALNRGDPVPDGWIVDAQGRPTNDPADFYGPPRGAILPLGGHKGYGLGFMVEMLAGAMTGNGCSAPGKDLLEQGLLSVFVDPLKLQPADQLFGEIRRYVEFVKSSRPAEPRGRVLVPGEPEEMRRSERSRGIELDATTWTRLVEAARECRVSETLIAAASSESA